MIAGFAIDTRAFAGGVRADHAPNGRPVARRELWGKKNTARFHMRIELI